jgi:hypothetical protein
VQHATPWISYEWPLDGVDPFDVAAPEPLWLLSDGSGRWGRGWPAGDRRDFGTYGDFLSRVPMGYRVVEIRERVALVAGGELVHASPRSDAPTWRGQWGTVGHLPYSAHPRTGSESRAGCPTEEEALDAAVQFSLAEPEVTWLVGRRIAIENWH